jgi:hypothetical protein
LLGQLQSLSSSRNETRQEAYFIPKSYKWEIGGYLFLS